MSINISRTLFIKYNCNAHFFTLQADANGDDDPVIGLLSSDDDVSSVGNVGDVDDVGMHDVGATDASVACGGYNTDEEGEEGACEDVDSEMIEMNGVLYSRDELSDTVLEYLGELDEGDSKNEDDTDGQTVQLLRDNMDKPLWEVGDVKAKLNVFQACCIALSEKRKGGIKDNAFDRMCKYYNAILPDGNFYPKSKYLMEKAIGCYSLDKVSLHMCPKECCVWPQLDKSEWKTREHDTCEECGSHRFKRNNSGKLQPNKNYFYFGVVDTIQSLFMDDDFVRVRGTKRDEDPYYTSAKAARLYTKVFVESLEGGLKTQRRRWGPTVNNPNL